MSIYTTPRNPLLTAPASLLAGGPHSASLAAFLKAPYGGDRGYATEGDVLVNTTNDGVDLLVVYDEIRALMLEWNKSKRALVDVLSYWHTSAGEAVPQVPYGETSFEEASEYGEPQSIRPPKEYALLGFDFRDYDLATRYTWKFLRDADARQVRAQTDQALNADERLVTGSILNQLFDPTPRENNFGHTVYGLWNGDGMVPPPWNGHTHDGNHSHYLVSNSVDIDSGDLLDAIKHLRHHGYGLVDSTQKILVVVNETESEQIQSWRANVENNNQQISKYDFIPASNQPAFMLEKATIVGDQPAGKVFGLPVVGSWGPALIVESWFVPEGYVLTVATSGPGSVTNPVGVREHENQAYRNLRIIPGRDQRYPLLEAFFSRSFGTGVRHRSSAVVTQLSAAGPYVPPSIPV